MTVRTKEKNKSDCINIMKTCIIFKLQIHLYKTCFKRDKKIKYTILYATQWHGSTIEKLMVPITGLFPNLLGELRDALNANLVVRWLSNV